MKNAIFDDASLVGASFAGVKVDDIKRESVQLSDSEFAEAVRGGDVKLSPEGRASLAKTLRDFVCSGDPNAIFVLRGLFSTDRLAGAGADIVPLLDEIEAGPPKCPLEALGVLDKMNVLKLRETIRSAKDQKG